VLVDGDGAKFLDGLLREPVSGASDAAQRLKQEVNGYLKETPLGAVDIPILVRIFANLNDLARSLRLSKVIESTDNMHIFAEQFTNSRAEFDFVNVGRGKENADSKMRSKFPNYTHPCCMEVEIYRPLGMFNHFLKNLQCKKIFFAGCHDTGYLHDLREYVGEPGAKERIVLVETTPVEPRFVSLGFPITRFSTVFRSEHLGNERRQTNPRLPSPPLATPPNIKELTVSDADSSDMPGSLALNHQSSEPTATSLANSESPSTGSPLIPPVILATQQQSTTTSITSSNNGGISINYPRSYAAAGYANGHQNMSVQTAKTKKPKTMEYNEHGHRLDPPSKNPGFNTPAQTTYKAKCDKVKPRVFCNNYYLAGNCKWGDKCDFDHSTILAPEEIAIHRYRARTSMCTTGPSCDDYSCYLSHHCTLDPYCARGSECKFKKTRFGDLHLSREELKPA